MKSFDFAELNWKRYTAEIIESKILVQTVDSQILISKPSHFCVFKIFYKKKV